ncbi:MAG: SusC/RagA family TonB-linked outer membrane protein [Leadbetterella sp.]|nr:SusC/RagA family TonB-linked outer membrane protein [Leadbetterella sp.]
MHISTLNLKILALLLVFMPLSGFSERSPEVNFQKVAGSELLKQRLSIHFADTGVRQILVYLEKKTGVRFAYKASLLPEDKKLTLHMENSTLEEIIQGITTPLQLDYQVVAKQIIFSPRVGATLDSPALNQDDRTLKGRVTDEKGEGLAGVNILTNTRKGAISDVEGNFSLQVTPEVKTLTLSLMGYQTETVTVSGSLSFLDIRLKEDQKQLEEIVVIGYGTARKSDLTGAVSSVKASDLEGQAPRSVQDLLRSNAPGLNIGMAVNAKPGGAMSIRGQGTLTASNAPLIVLNNVIYEGALEDINAADVATIDILKDASAAAVYGSRAANGVIVITTKRGRKGKPLINLVSNYGIARAANVPKILDENSFLKFRQDYNEGRNSASYLAKYPQIFRNPYELDGIQALDWYNYDQKTPVTSVTDQQLQTQWLSRLNFTTPEMVNYFAGNITHWDDLVFQAAQLNDHNVSVSNATDNTSLYFSLGYTNREGVVVGDQYKTFRVRLNYESKITNFLTIGANTQFAKRNEGYLPADWSAMTTISPYGSNNIDDPTSIYRRRPTGLDPINPFYDNLYTERVDRKHNFNATLYGKVQLPLGIEYSMNFSPYLHFSEYYNHYSAKGDNWVSIGGIASRNSSYRSNWQIDNILKWSKTLGADHRVDVTLLANAEKGQFWSTAASSSTFSPNDNLGYHNLQSGAVPKVSSDDNSKTGDALMARVFYSLKNRYMITASLRRDGYSAFGKKNPRATFPALALAWTFSDEDFMKDNSWLNTGKLRLSWGENGNREIGQYAALATMSSSLIPYIDASGKVYSTSQVYLTTMANHNLKWERSASLNLGLDFSALDQKLSGSLDVYNTATNDLLVSRRLPNITGYSSVMSNLGQVKNKGIEAMLRYNVLKNRDWKWDLIGNFTLNRRKITSLYGDYEDVLDKDGNVVGHKEADDETNGWFIGQDPDRIWSYQRAGVWQLGEEEEAAKYGLQPGDFKYLDINNDGIMNNEDKVFQGYTTPRERISLRSETQYKNFRFSFSLYSYLNYYAPFQRAANNYAFPDRTSDYDFPRWTSTNPINDYARIGSKNIGVNYVNQSFVRLDQVTLSYALPSGFLSKLSVQACSISVNLQNGAVWSPRWNFWDPETGTVTPRIVNFGLNLTL